ncbi:MAG: cell division ATP-binding protein FtsE [Acidobacteriota bacterium]|jgi:cell division transport system ATP-binding protein
MIRFYHITKSYRQEKPALSDVTLGVEPRQFCFVTGPSGAGKTTLLKLIIREERPSAGQILVNGRNLNTLSHRQLPYFRRRIGVVFQDFRLIPSRNIYENVALVLRLMGVPAKERKRRAFEALRWVGLQSRMNAFPEELSGGEQQRVAIARALINRPVILLADEPTGNLDPDLSHEIMTLFQEVNAAGTTVVVATHDRQLIAEFGGRVILLDRGHVADPGE